MKKVKIILFAHMVLYNNGFNAHIYPLICPIINYNMKTIQVIHIKEKCLKYPLKCQINEWIKMCKKTSKLMHKNLDMSRKCRTFVEGNHIYFQRDKNKKKRLPTW